MNFKEFKEYKNRMTENVSVNPDGTMSNDNYLKYNLSYNNEKNINQNQPIIARTLAEAIYRACVSVLINHLPTEVEVVDSMNANDVDEMQRLRNVLDKCKDFEQFDLKAEGEYAVSICYTCDSGEIETYYLSLEDTDSANYEKLLRVSSENNMIICSSIDSDNVIITNIASPATEIRSAFNPNITNPYSYFGWIRNNLLASMNSVVSSFGFASCSEEDEFSYNKGLEIARKRALLNKIEINRKMAIEMADDIKRVIDTASIDMNRYYKLSRKLSRRKKQLDSKIRELYK